MISGDGVDLLLGTGADAFGVPIHTVTGDGAIALAVGDFNQDHHLDAAVLDAFFGDITILRGDGLAGFSRTIFGTMISPAAIGAGDLTGDGLLDLAVANYTGNDVSVLIGHGNGGFDTGLDFGVGSEPRAIASGHLNSDLLPDLITANQGSGNIAILLNQSH